MGSSSPSYLSSSSTGTMSSSSSGFINSNLQMSTMDPNLRLWSNSIERDQHENSASLFAIIKATEALEKAYARDIIEKSDYKEECSKLIAQFRRALKLADVKDVKGWMEQQNLKCQAAYHRLVESGVPDTGETENTQKIVAEIVQDFISIQDSIKLEMVDIDHLHPYMQGLYDRLSRFSSLPADSDIKMKVQKWLYLLNKMSATDKLDADQSRQMLFDIASAYDAFYKVI